MATDSRPPVDPNQPVENAALVARLLRSSGTGEDDAAALVTMRMIRDATYLIATQVSHPDGGAPIVDGMMRAGTRINVYTVRLPDGRPALAAFTDWSALRAAVGEGAEWSGLIQPGEDLFRMALSPDYAGGVVVNPSGPDVTLEMTPERIAWMFSRTG
jgi:hypothetical protein